MKRLYTKQELEKIETHIKRFEEKTSGQIVVVTAFKSDPYTSVPLRFGIVGILFSSLCYLLMSRTLFWFPLPYLFCFQFLGFIAFSLFGKTSFALRRFVPAGILALRVRKAALASFVEKGVHETEKNTGIIIYLSEMERRVEIIADTNAFKVLGIERLQKEASHIIQGIKNGKALDAITKSIDDLAFQLQDHFPKTGINKNELSDDVRVE